MTAQEVVAQSVLPTWLIISGAVAGFFSAVLQIGTIIYRKFTTANLEISLTKEIFFRLIDDGETIFANAVFVARNDSVEIRDVKFFLEKQDLPATKAMVSVLHVGEKVKGKNTFSDYHFYSKSTIALIPKDSPQRVVYLAVLNGSENEMIKLVNDYLAKIEDLKKEFEQIKNSAQEIQAEFFKSIDLLVKSTADKVFDRVHIKKGHYKLTLEATYRVKSIFGHKLKKSSSSISFQIEDFARDLLRNKLSQSYLDRLVNTISNKNLTVIYPEYQPIQIKEH